tara:strand:- start:1 stop:669 length:669 start_codon:yes stop_codon:yes gene_type:complete
MWINEDKKLIYLCNPKCGSSTVRDQLKKQNFINLGPKQQKICNGHWNHAPMKMIVNYLKIIGKNPYDYTYFTIIREPINRLISNFIYCQFDKDWNAFYSRNKTNALMDFSKEYNFTYNRKYNYTINDYISFGLEKSNNLCTHPMPIIDYSEILDERFNIFIFKLENMDDLKKFLEGFDIIFDTNLNTNSRKYDGLKIRNTITEKSIDKIHNIYKYEYTHYYK